MTMTGSHAAEGEAAPMKPPPRLPRISDTPPAVVPAPPAEADHSGMLGLLVEGDEDVVGLVAYGLYKQNKRDWLLAHRAAMGRAPAAAEIDAFILGESMPRRIATYRRLAWDMLAARARPSVEEPAAPPTGRPASAAAEMASAARKPVTWRYIAFLLAMLVVMAVIFRLTASWLFGTGR
jgi:hypothetical protein